jgi:hypothetical protein
MTPTPIGALLGKHWSIICNPKKGDASIKCQTTTQVGQRAGWDKKTHDAFSCPNSAFLDKQGSWAGGSWAEKTCSLTVFQPVISYSTTLTPHDFLSMAIDDLSFVVITSTRYCQRVQK